MCQAARSTKYKGQTLALSVLCITPFSVLLCRAGGAQLWAGAIASTSSPGFTPRAGQQLLRFYPGNRLLPRPKQKDATAVCRATSNRTQLSIAASAVGSSLGVQTPRTQTQVKNRAVVPDEIHPLFSTLQRAGASQEQVTGSEQLRLFCKTARVSWRRGFSVRQPPRRELAHASYPSCHPAQQRQPAPGSPRASKPNRSKQPKTATCRHGLGLKTLRFRELPKQENPKHSSYGG